MQLIYAPYNVFKWCLLQKYLPDNSLIVFGLFDDMKDEPETDDDSVKIVVDLMLPSYKQAYQIFVSVAAYLVGEDRVAITEKAAELLDKWSLFGRGERSDDVAVEESCKLTSKHIFVHPVFHYLRTAEEFYLVDDTDFIFLGESADKLKSKLVDDDLRSFQLSSNFFIEQIQQLRANVIKYNDKESEEKIWNTFIAKWSVFEETYARFAVPKTKEIKEACSFGEKIRTAG